MTQVNSHETHISAQQVKARSQPWVSCAHGHQGRAPHLEAPSRQRSRAVGAVTPPAPPAAKSNHPGLTGSQSNRFGKDNRLPDAAAFGRVFQKASRSRDKLFTVLCRRNEKGAARLGLAISKKHCRQAARRNRIKRIIRESFRQQQASLAGLDIVVINQPAADSASNRQMFRSLESHWHRCREAKRIPQEG